MRVGPADKLEAFQRAYVLALEVHRLTGGFPRSEQYGGVAEQLRRSSKAVCANLVEGAGRQSIGTRAEFRRFVVMALGSAEESRLWLRFAGDLGYLPPVRTEALGAAFAEVARMLQGLARHLSEH